MKPKDIKTEKSAAKSEQRSQKFQSAMENFNQKEVPTEKPKKKNGWLSFVVLLIAIAIGVFLIIKMSAEIGSEQKSFAEVFSSVQLNNALLAVSALVLMLTLDIVKFVIIIHATTNKLRLGISSKVSLWGRYYDNITPFAAGGQPAQIIYLHQKGFSGGLSSAVVLIKYFFNTFIWLAVGCVAMAGNTSVLQSVSNGNVLKIAGWVGWALNMLVPVAILSFVVMPKLATKITSGLIFVGHKLKIVKNKEKTMQKALNTVQDFRSSFIIMAKRPLHMALLVVTCVAEISLTFAFPYFVIKMFNGFAVDEGFATMFSVMGLNAFATLGASVIPTPGSSGAVEGMITMAFSNIAGSTLMWVTFTWRFAVFYLYIIIGLGITIFNFVRNFVRARKAKASEGIATQEVGESAAETPTRFVEVEFDDERADCAQSGNEQNDGTHNDDESGGK
ncbi:MAG: YbhN family protein [Candidatus Fimimonas sp.]